jgi:hypothetical protein
MNFCVNSAIRYPTFDRATFGRIQCTRPLPICQSHSVSVELVNRAAYQTPDAAIIGLIARAEGLAEEWKDMVSARLNR